MENVRNIVESVLESKGWSGKVLEQMAVELWPEVVGDHIAKNTVAEKFTNGTLHIRARSPQWTQELHFHEARVIIRLNGRLRRNLVHKIRCYVTPPRGIRVGTLKPNWEDPTFPIAPPEPRDAKPDRDDEAVLEAQKICESIEDPEVRAALEKVITSSKRAATERKRREGLKKTAPRKAKSSPTSKTRI